MSSIIHGALVSKIETEWLETLVFKFFGILLWKLLSSLKKQPLLHASVSHINNAIADKNSVRSYETRANLDLNPALLRAACVFNNEKVNLETER